MRATFRSRRLAPLAATLALAGAIALGAGASAATVPLSVHVLRTSQQAILATGKVAARVKVDRPGRVRIAPKAKLPGARPFRIGKVRRVVFRRGRGRLLRFPLTEAGRRLIAGCRAKSLVFSAKLGRPRARGASASAPISRKTVSAALVIDRPACRSTAGGAAPDPDNPAAQPYIGAPIGTANSGRCDFLDTAVCLQPWPNDLFTAEDSGTDTGRRVDLNILSMPQNGAGVPINPIDYNHNDGFSPGQMIVTKVPGLETPAAFDATGAVSIDHPELYDDPNQPVVVINADTGRRQPVFAELDSNPTDPHRPTPGTTDDVNLLIRPLRNFDEGAHYIVALRDLKTAGGDTIQPADAFRVYRDRLITTQGEVESRRDHMEELFGTLQAAGIKRSNLYLAWDFTVASERNLSERALAIRDDAFEQLGDTNLANLTVEGDAPDFMVTGTSDDPATGIAREVTGQVTVPCYLDTPGCPPGSRFAMTPGSDVPTFVPGNTMTANFTCEIPESALTTPARPSLYGHGLLGSASEVGGGNIEAMAREHNMIFCATDWAGFATTDVPTVLAALQDLSQFPRLVDRMQQGFVNFMYLGRAMIHEHGLGTDPAFQNDSGDSVIDPGRLFYDGNSQGGIMGGAYTALSVDSDRSVLGVPGMNYSTLLSRSVDFEPYAEGQFGETVEEVLCDQFGSLDPDDLPDEFPQEFQDLLLDLREQLIAACVLGIPDDTPLGLYDNYPNQLERPLIFSLIQMVWDRGEANGYANHMTTDSLDNTPAHNVLLHPAFGDHQVANIAAETEARTIGAHAYEPAFDPGRHWQSDPFFQIPPIPEASLGGPVPWGGSAIVYWDGGPLGFPGGTATPPNENIPPRPPAYGSDPHSYPRNDVKARAQKSDFLKIGGLVRNYCTTDSLLGTPVLTGTAIPCYSHGWTGP